MRKLRLALCALLMLVAKVNAIMVGPFPGLDKLIGMSDTVMIVHIDRKINSGGWDGWGIYECSVLRVLMGPASEKERVRVWVCGFINVRGDDIPSETMQLVFLKKDSTNAGDYRAPAVMGAVMRAEPSSHLKQPRGDTVRERIEQVIREGRDYCQMLYAKEQKLFSEALGEGSQVKSAPKR